MLEKIGCAGLGAVLIVLGTALLICIVGGIGYLLAKLWELAFDSAATRQIAGAVAFAVGYGFKAVAVGVLLFGVLVASYDIGHSVCLRLR